MNEKKTNGFTLIELLAVIILLAVIALIAIPSVINLINEGIKKSFVNSVYGVMKAGDLYYSRKDLMDEFEEEIIFEFPNNIEGLEIKGKIPESGKMKIDENGDITLAVTNGRYCVRKIIDREELVVNENIENCILPVTLSEVATTSEELGITTIDNCMLNGLCEPGTPFAINVNDNETYKFYVTEDNGDEITLIMSENTSEKIAWYADKMNNNSGPVTALNQLKNDTDGWTSFPERTYIVKDDGGYNKYEPIQTTMRTRMFTYTEAQKLGCAYNGVNLCPDFLSGNYWLSSAAESYAEAIRTNSKTLQSYIVTYTSYAGIRPVITVVANKKQSSLVSNVNLETEELITIPGVATTVKTIVTPSEANNKKLKWSSSNTNIVTVDDNGMITGVNTGNAIVYVETTDGTNIKKQINATVNKPKKLSEIVTTSETLQITEVNNCINTGICEPGTPFAIKVNDTETYKFYVISDDGKEVALIMNQNVGDNTMWKELETIEGPVSVFNILQEQTSSWINIALRPYTLSDDLPYGLGGFMNTYLNVNFYNMRSRILSQTEANSIGCVRNEGCPDYLTENTNGYWLSTSNGGINSALAITSTGINWYYSAYKFQKNGVRPVIIVPKN